VERQGHADLVSAVLLLGRYLNSGQDVLKIHNLIKKARSEHVSRDPTTTSARGPRRLTKAVNEEIARLYVAGMRPVQIAREVGTTEWTVHPRLNRMGIERRPTGLSPNHVREASRLYEEGESIRQIRLKIGFSDKTIKKALLEAGVDVRDGRRNH
jgi:DNA-binding NarL/FixJ family response regulator